MSFDKSVKSLLQQNVPTATMTAVNVNQLQKEDMVNDKLKNQPWRFGQNLLVNLNPKNSGVWDNLPNGDKLWRLRIYSPGALTINLAFDKYRLPKGAVLFVYNAQKTQVIGAFTDFNNQKDNQFATTLISGEAVIVEYYEPAKVSFKGELNIFRVTHGYRNAADYAKDFGDSGTGACNNNARCPVSTGWDEQIRSVCMLVTGGSGFCTGALVNNTANDGTPYVLTANHCSTSDDFGTWVFWFNWESPDCNNPAASPAHNDISGSVLKARSAGSDFCLVQMNQTPPTNYNTYYSGWNREGVAVPDAYCIHHPQGDIKKFSVSSALADSLWSSTQCWKATWTNGLTEPGSSGSPLFDGNHRIIGQLYGGPSGCNNGVIENPNDFFGKFSTSWNTGTTPETRLIDWLDPASTSPITQDGFDPNVPTGNNDAQMLQITSPVNSYCSAETITPSVVIKNKGIDNLTSVNVNYNIDGGATETIAWTGNLATNETATINFPNITLNTGTHTFTAFVSLPNGVADEATTNDQIVKTYTIVSPVNLPLTENFAGATFPPTNWTINNPDGGTTWVNASSSSSYDGSFTAAYIECYNYQTTGALDGLTTPLLNLNGLTNASIHFDIAHRRYKAANQETLNVLVSTDCGTTWTSVYAKTGVDLATGTDTTGYFFPKPTNWRTENINIDNYIGNNALIKFESTNGWGNNIFITNINIDNSFVNSIGETVLNQNLMIFPNPTSGLVNINSNQNINKIEVLDLTGRVIVSELRNTTQTTIDLSKLNNGVYFVKVNTEKGNYTQKIVLTK